MTDGATRRARARGTRRRGRGRKAPRRVHFDNSLPDISQTDREKSPRVWGDFLNEFEWTFFTTLTFDRERSPWAAEREYRAWVRRVEQRTQAKVSWFYVVERSRGGRIHLHSLCHSPNGIGTLGHFDGAWGRGRVHIERYDKKRGARYYVAKTMGKEAEILGYDIHHTR